MGSMDKQHQQGLPEPTADNIRDLLYRHDTTRAQAAALLHVSLFTVNGWMAPVTSARYTKMPPGAWELLLIKLGEHPEWEAVGRT